GRHLPHLERPDHRQYRQGSTCPGRGGGRQVPWRHQLLRSGRRRHGAWPEISRTTQPNRPPGVLNAKELKKPAIQDQPNPSQGSTMTADLRKRTFIKFTLSALGAASLAACGKKEEATAPAPSSDASVGATTDAAPVTAAAEPLKAAWIYVGPVGSAGWSFAHDLGRKAVEAEFGDKVKTTFVESVPEGADTERVVRDLVSQGNKLIFGTSFGFMEAMLKVARDHPDVKFEHATGYKTADNMNVYDSR